MAMSCKHRRDKLTSFLFVVSVYLYTFQVSHSVSLGPRGEGLPAYKVQESTATGRERITRDEDAQRGDRDPGETPRGPRPRKSNRLRRTGLRPESAVFPAEPVPFHSAPTLDGSLPWTLGKVRPGPRSTASDSEDGYQADFTGFRGVQGKIFGPSFESSSHLSEWLAMNPVVQCDYGVMTFTASGKEFRHMFLDRERASPISPFQLPPYCRYSVRKSRKDLEMMVPYDACYVTQQHGPDLHLLLNYQEYIFSCPLNSQFPDIPSPLPQLPTQEQMAQLPGIPHSPYPVFQYPHLLQVYPPSPQPTQTTVALATSSPNINPVQERSPHQFPKLPVGSSEYALGWHYPYNPFYYHAATPAPTSAAKASTTTTAVLPTQEQMVQLPGIPHSPYPGFQYPHLLQVYPPSPQPTQTTVAQATSSPNINPVQESSAHKFPKLPVGSSEYAPGWHYPYNPFYYHAATPVPTSAAKESTTTTAVLPTQEQMVQLPGIPHSPYPGFQYPHLLQVYPPSPQPTQTTVAQATSSPNINPVQESSAHQFPKLPVGSSEYAPGWHYPYNPFYYHAATPVPTSAAKESTTTTAVLPTQEQMAQLPGIPHSPDPGFQYPHLLQVYPPSPQPTQTTVAQATSSPNMNLVQENSPHQFFHKLPVGSSEYAPGWYYPYNPFYYHTATPVPTSAAKESTTTTAVPPASPNYPWYYRHMPYYPAAPGTQAPASFDPSQHTVSGAFHPPDSYGSYYPYGQFFYPGLEVQPASSSHPIAPPSLFPPITTRAMAPTQPGSPSYPSGQFPASHYPYPYYHPLHPPPYHPPYQPLPQDPAFQPPITTTTTPPTTSSTTAGPTSQIPHLQCLVRKLVVFLPFAHPDTIQVRDQMETWLFISVVSPLCGYMLQSAEGHGLILHSPLPACYSQLLTPTNVSLITLRFLDLSVGLYRSLDLRCPYPTTNDTPVPVTPPVSSTPPSITEDKVDPTVVPKSKVYCSSHQMTVELPSGPFSGIVFKDIEGNQMSFQDAPEHCGYSARKGKDDKIHLTIQLLSHCHMSVQGKMYTITVVYMTVNGRREAQFSCPVVIPGSGLECNLISEQRLPCGPDPVSLPQCRSMGCCFDSHHLACYYPMDECTIDRHFVFSVSASLTEPPLSPGLLVVAGNSTCKPQRVTADYALFKIPMDGCGTRRVAVGNTVVYMVEVINKVQSISLNYGTITRDSPIRLLVECRFVPGTLLSVSYMVKTPTLGPEVPAQGMFGVQLRIAKDAQYSSYYPQNHPPLQMLLGKPLYLEVRLLNASDPSLVLLVHFCVAYPLSGKAVWLLLYNGCPNPMDPAMQQAVLSGPRPPTPRAQTRRFTINTFQFLPDSESMDPDEENNFMCSTEICSPRDGPCVEGCFSQ